MPGRPFTVSVTADNSVESGSVYPPRIPEQDRLERRQKAFQDLGTGGVGVILAFVVAFVSFALPGDIGTVVGVILLIGAVIAAIPLLRLVKRGADGITATEQIPDQAIVLPPPIQLVTDELWRTPTPFRYLEELKSIVRTNEENAQTLRTSAEDAFRQINSINSYASYERIKNSVDAFSEFKADYERVMPQIKERVRTIFSGQVIEEINALQADIKRLRRERQEIEESHAEKKEQYVVRKQEGRSFAAAWAGASGELLKSSMKDVDIAIINKEAAIAELRAFNFPKLYKQLGLPEDWQLMSIEELEEIKKKSELIGTIRQTTQPMAQEVNPKDERKQRRAECELRIDDLQRDKQNDLERMRSNGSMEEEIRRRENMWDDAVVKEEEELRKWL